MTPKRITISPVRPVAKKARARLAHALHAFFMRQAPKLIGQVVTLRGTQPFVKADLSDDELDKLNEIIAGLDFAGWASLVGEIDPVIAQAVRDGGYDALKLIGLDVTADRDVFNVVNDQAVDYAQERSAGLVGKRMVDGDLIDNPRADYAITESTRDFLRSDIADAISGGWTNAQLASKLADNYAFSADRATVIARTETIRASNQGTLAGFKSSGVVLKKEWTTADDDLVSEDCEENGDAGPIDLDDAFPSGDDAPPAHPNCRCALVGLTEYDTEESEA